MITRLYLENFRAFEKLDIPLARINCFFGPNNSGKSAILSAINVLSQTLDSSDRDVPLLLNGKFEELGSYEDTVYGHDLNRDIRIGFDIEESGADSSDSSPQSVRFIVTFHYRKQRRQIVIGNIEVESPVGELLLRTRVSERSNIQIVEKVSSKFANVKVGLTLPRN